MRDRLLVWAPVVTLMIVAPLLAEVFSGSMPVTQFIAPQIFFPFTIFVYGLPIVVIREVAVRNGFGLVSLALLGMIYALYNEGLFSETLFHPLDHPVAAYADYGLFGEIRVPWLGYILPWHAVFSVVTPVLIVSALFPAKAGRPWLPRNLTLGIGVVTGLLAFSRFLFRSEDVQAQSMIIFAGHLGFILVAGLVLVLLAMRFRSVALVNSSTSSERTWPPVLAGMMIFVATFAALQTTVEAQMPAWIPPVFALVCCLGGSLWLSRRKAVPRLSAIRFLLGLGVGQTVVVMIGFRGLVGGDVMALVVGVVALGAYAVALAALRRSASQMID